MKIMKLKKGIREEKNLLKIIYIDKLMVRKKKRVRGPELGRGGGSFVEYFIYYLFKQEK